LTDDTEGLNHDDKFSIQNVTAICRMDTEKDLYQVYSPNGLLLKRINFSHFRAQYGTPVAQSGNGRIMAFRRTNTFLTMMNDDKNLRTKTVDRALTFTILEMTPSGMRFHKIVNVFEGMDRALEKAGSGMRAFKRSSEWLYCENFEEMQRRLTVKVEVNDLGDICVKLAPNRKKDNGRTIFYFESGAVNDEANALPDLDGFRTKSKRKKTRIHNQAKTEGFRAILDPHGIDASTEKIINAEWSHDIHDFTLNNHFIIFRSDVKLW
jgi:hypothetical protein